MIDTLTVTTKIPSNRELKLKLPDDFPVDDRDYCITVAPKASDKATSSAFRTADGRLVYYPRRPEHPQLAVEFDEFERQLPELMKLHKNRYVAMLHGQVIGSGDDRVKLLNEVARQNPCVFVYIRLVTDEPLPVERLGRSVREVR